ncbi:MAG: hypothetical protein BroJett012_31600 [Betaproteobacteria bacterium]|nr:MAG: hypothetical protein BroJett012_31600 [Betaproteobacteria bacterium]
MNAPASQHVTVIFSADEPERGGARVASRVLAGVLHLSFAGALFYTVWWPVDFKLTEILLWNLPFTTQWQIDEAMSTLLEGPTESAAVAPASRDGVSGGTDGDAFVYPSRQRAPILLLSVYGLEAIAAAAVLAWALAGGLVLGRILPAGLRQGAARAAVLLAAGLVCWGAWIAWTTRTGFPVSTGQVAVGGAALVCAFVGLGRASGGAAASVMASIWQVVCGAAAYAAVTLMARCEALEAQHTSAAFKAGVFAAVTGYAWCVLVILVVRSRRTSGGYVRT